MILTVTKLMAYLNMSGPCPLSLKDIDTSVEKGSIGNFALGFLDNDNKFIVQYVGRSDSDLNEELKKRVNRYKYFKFSYAIYPMAAFEKECRNYHEFGEQEQLHNKVHPQRPSNSDWRCPVCNIYDEEKLYKISKKSPDYHYQIK